MWRLSIFNSDSLQLAGFRPKGLAVCLLLLAVVELGVARRTWIWTLYPKSPSGVFDVVEQKVLRPVRDPAIVIMGNSRVRDALDPVELSRAVGQPPGSVLNISLTNGRPFDMLMLYERNRETFQRARLLIIGIEDWWFHTGSRKPSERIRRFATLEQRWKWFEGATRLSLLAGWAWRTLDAKDQLSRFVKFKFVRRDWTVPIGIDGRVVWRKTEADFGPKEDVKCAQRATQTYANFDFDASKIELVEQLIQRARRDNLTVIVIRPPLRDLFVDRRSALVPGIKRAFGDQMKAIDALDENVHVMIFEKCSDLGWPQHYLLDYGHVGRVAARQLSRQVGQHILETAGRSHRTSSRAPESRPTPAG